MTANRPVRNFRKFTISRTVAVLPPRRSKTKPINSGIVSFFSSVAAATASSSSCVSPSFSNSVSLKSTRPTTSTSTFWRIPMAFGFANKFINSPLDIIWSPSSSAPVSVRSRWMFSRTSAKESDSRSVAATAETTSQMTPISMFITVRAERKMKPYKTNNKTRLCSISGNTKLDKPSINAAFSSNSCIAAGTFGKKISQGESSQSWTKAIPKM
mmetsp:Transcript_50209/g.96936  ORF Transcript_50209/g.96936 Transcript_50209/m.96936 type:complete len:213 (-) Transcript_50209:256-894(-)